MPQYAKPIQLATDAVAAYPTLIAIRNPLLKCLSARYKNAKVYTAAAYPLLSPQNPLKAISEHRWTTRTETFWWSALPLMDIGNKRVVRSWVTRRARIAFREALTAAGFQADGNPIEGSGKKDFLYGTLQISVTDQSVKADQQQLREEADIIVAHVIKQQKNGTWGLKKVPQARRR